MERPVPSFLKDSLTVFAFLKQNNEIKVLQQQNAKPIPKPRTTKPVPLPRKSVKQMVRDYEDNIVPPTPKPRIISKKPVPAPRTRIERVANSLKGYTKSFEISIKHKKDPLKQLQNTRLALEKHIESLLTSMKGLKFVETLSVTFTKPSNGETIYKNAYFNSKPQTIINNTEISGALQLTKDHILNLVAQWISEGSGWVIESVDKHYLNIVKYEPMKGSSYIKLPEELQNAMKGLINMKNEDNQCFRWCHIRHLNPKDTNPQRIKNPIELTSIN